MKALPLSRSVIVWRANYINAGITKSIRTICEVLRELYRDAEARSDSVSMQRLDEASDMAMRMQDRLKVYALTSKKPVTLTVDDVGEMLWLTKKQYKRAFRKDLARRKGRLR